MYVNKGVYFLRENDNLMQEIKERHEEYNIDPIETIVTEHFIIPGISGKKVNIKKSYNNMKGLNKFKESLLIFDDIKPNTRIDNVYNKIIIGNPKENKICLLTSLDNKYCYTDNLTIDDNCIKENKYTFLIHKVNNNYLTNIKKNLRNGIVFFLNSINQDELYLTKKFIKNNNYILVDINELISF